MNNDDLTYFLNAFRRRFLFFLVAFVAVLGGAIAVAMFWPRIYESKAIILVESQRIPVDLVRSTVTAVADERIQVIKQRVRARDNMLAVMRKYDLFPNRKNKLRWSQSELIELIKERTAIERISTSPGRSRRQLPTIAFTVSFQYEHPNVAASVANEFVTFILSEDIRARTSRASETTTFLSKESVRLAKELTATEAQLSELKTKFKNALPEKLQFNLLALERAQKDLTDLDQLITQNEMNKQLLERQIGGVSDDKKLKDQLNQLKIVLAQKQANFSDAHPEIKRLRQMVSALQEEANGAQTTEAPKKKVAQSDKDQTTSETEQTPQLQMIGAALKSLRSRRAALAKNVADLKANIDSTSQVELTLTSLQRKYESLQNEYTSITAKESNAELGEKLEENKQAERFQVIEAAVPGSAPIKPNRLLILGMGLFAAFGAGLGGVILAETLDNTVRTNRALVEAFDFAPIATVPLIRTQREARRTGAAIVLATVVAIVTAAASLVAIDQFYKPIPLLIRDVMKMLMKLTG